MAKTSPGYKPTVFPGGTAQKTAVLNGGSAGDHTVASSFGLEAGDLIQQVYYYALSGVLISTQADITSEFTRVCAAANTVSNTGGTDTTGALLHVVFVDVDARES